MKSLKESNINPIPNKQKRRHTGLIVALICVFSVFLVFLLFMNIVSGGHVLRSLFVFFPPVLIGGIVFVAYFIPSFVAYKVSHRNMTAIIVLNIFAGWTFAGWVIALVWAVKKDAGVIVGGGI